MSSLLHEVFLSGSSCNLFIFTEQLAEMVVDMEKVSEDRIVNVLIEVI